MSQKLPVDDFEWKIGKFNLYEDFIKPMRKTVTKDTYFKLILSILRNYKKQTVIYHSYPKELILVNAKTMC